MINKNIRYELWTDGSCYHKDRIGGWAFCLVENDKIKHEDFFFCDDVTSALMELRAGLEAVTYFNKNFKNEKVLIVTDYATLSNCFNERWYKDWIELDFSGIKNEWIWKSIFKEVFSGVNKFEFKHVKGHSNIFFNERVDFLAGFCRKYRVDDLKK